MASGQVGRLSVRVLPDTTEFRRDLKKAMERAERSVKPTIDVALNVTTRSLANVKRQLQGLEATVPVTADLSSESKQIVQRELEGMDAKATIEADPDTTYASARLSNLARPRFAQIIPTLDKGAATRVATALAALSGARSLRNFGRGLTNFVKNLDQSLPAIAGAATAITTLGAAGLAATSNLFALGASFASILPAALALPGILAGFGVGLGVTIAALADAGDVLGDLGPKFAALQDIISTNFWARAEGPIRSLANNVLPILNDRLGEVGSALGGFFGNLAGAFNTPANLGLLDGMLVNLRDSISIASEGIGDFIDGLMGLGSAGASYLPALAGWFNDISASFSGWVQENTANGQLFEWIDTGIAALQDLGRALGAAGGILGGFATAAANAGGANLGALADGLENVNAAVNGPAFQGALTTTFQGAHDAMEALGPGFAALGDAFTKFAPTLAEILVLAGQVASVGLAGIAAAIETPAFQSGLTTFFEGILAGVEAILPYMPQLATAFGAVASFAGTLASVIGPVLGAAIGALAPVVTDLMGGLSAIAPVLGGVLVSAIQTLAPFIQQIVSAITDWVTQNPQFAAGLLVAAGAVAGLVVGAVSLITALAPLVSSIIGIVSGLSAMGVTMSGVGTAIATVLGPLLAIVAGIAALGALLIYAWQTSEQFRTAVATLGQAIMGFIAPIIAFIQSTVIPVITQIVTAFINGAMMIINALVPLVTVIVQIAAAIIQRLTPIITFILSVLAPVFTFLGNVVSSAFNFIATVISTIINIVTSILQVFLAVIQGDWSAAWAAIKNVISTVWSGIQAVVGAAISFVRTVISSGLQAIKGVWSAIWSAISSFVSSVWSAIVSAISGFISDLVGRVVNFVNDVKSNIQNGFNAAKEAATDAFQRLVSSVKDKISDLLSRVREIPGDIKSGLGNLGSLLYSAGQDVIRGMIDGIKNMAGSLVDAATGVVGDAVDGAKNLLGINSPSTVFREIGEYTGEGMIIGLDRKARGVNDAMSAMVEPPGLPSSSGARDSAGRYADGAQTVVYVTPPTSDDPGTWGQRISDTLDLRQLRARAGGA